MQVAPKLLFMYFSLEFNKDHFKKLPTSLDDLKFNCTDEFSRAEFGQETFYILLGRIYNFESPSLKNLAQFLRTDPQGAHGRFVLIEGDLKKQTLSVWQDKYRLLNPLIAKADNFLRLGNSLNNLPKVISQNRDEIAAESLRDFGAVIYPRTLFKGMQFLTGHGQWDLEQDSWDMSDHAMLWPTIGIGQSVESWTKLLKESITDIFKNWNPTFFRISGGVDTRLIAFLIPQEFKKNLKAQVLVHPEISKFEDRDVIGAQLVSQSEGFNIDILERQPENYTYVGGLDSIVCSGLYGGEFLGGLMYSFSPLESFLDHLNGHKNISAPEWQQRLKIIGSRRLTTELYLSSFRSTIYDSVRMSWASPWKLNQISLSPFVEQKILDALLETPFKEVENYLLYADIFKHIAKERVHWPLSSPIVEMQPGFKSFAVGKEPKNFAATTEVTATSSAPSEKSLGAKNLEQFLLENPNL